MDEVVGISSELDLLDVVSRLYEFDFVCGCTQTKLLNIVENKFVPIVYLCTSLDSCLNSFIEEYQKLVDVPLALQVVYWNNVVKDMKRIV